MDGNWKRTLTGHGAPLTVAGSPVDSAASSVGDDRNQVVLICVALSRTLAREVVNLSRAAAAAAKNPSEERKAKKGKTSLQAMISIGDGRACARAPSELHRGCENTTSSQCTHTHT